MTHIPLAAVRDLAHASTLPAPLYFAPATFDEEKTRLFSTTWQLVGHTRQAAKPGDYFQRIYGLQEVGGTSVIYLSAVPFEQIGLRTNLPQQPLSALTWRALEAVPDVVSVGSVLLGGIWWITNRRDAVAKAEGGKQ